MQETIREQRPAGQVGDGVVHPGMGQVQLVQFGLGHIYVAHHRAATGSAVTRRLTQRCCVGPWHG
jgi:hypothetical protein